MKKNEYHKMFSLEEKNWWFVGKREIVLSLLRKYFSKVKKETKILNIGCGTGVILKDLQNFGKVVGVDISPEALSFCKERGFNNLYQASATKIPFDNESFDLIIALDVLEHIEEDKAALEECFRVLKKGGQLLLSVPAFMFLWSKHDEAMHHKRRYSKKELESKLNEIEFLIKKISFTNFFIFPVVLISRLFKRNRRLKSDNPAVPSILNAFLIKLYRIEAKILEYTNLPLGVSIICIAQKI